MKIVEPVELKPARAWRTYLGGSQIDRIHGAGHPQDSHFPEEWMMSTVVARNPGRESFRDEGLSYLKDGAEGGIATLKQLVEAEPEAMLGAGHVKAYGTSTGVLVKIIDSLERLTIQVHPDKAAAKELFQSQFGKTECWHILGTRENMEEKPCIYMGFKEGVTRGKWMELFRDQDIPEMLGCLHRFEVEPGETFLIHGGVPHAIGAGCMLIEIQEPTDYTIRTEQVTPSGLRIADAQCHQGLGFDRMFDCFHYDGCSKQEARDRWQVPGRIMVSDENVTRISVVDEAYTPCFRLEEYEVGGECRIQNEKAFSGIYVVSGEGELGCGDYIRCMRPGSQFFLPAACGAAVVKRAGEMPIRFFRFYGPAL